MRRALAGLAILCVLMAPSASASTARAPSPRAAKAAFGRLLHQVYGEVHGYWTCFPPAIKGRLDCLAEVHIGRRWHQVSASAGPNHGEVGIYHAETWTRHWSPFSRHFILRSGESQVPGVVSVNSPAYDWGWLAGGAGRLKNGKTRRVDALDGDDNGVQRFFIFTCSARGHLITCRNALGDAMRYRP